MNKQELSIESSKSMAAIPLNMDTIKQYICKDATEQELKLFMELCIRRDLNPFLKEAYLIKYSKDVPATMVVSKDAILKRACRIPTYKGFSAGVILINELGAIVETGGIIPPNHTLIGGWCTVFREGKEPLKVCVNLSEYRPAARTDGSKDKTQWTPKGATMIRKVAVVHAHREAFPEELSKMYEECEMMSESLWDDAVQVDEPIENVEGTVIEMKTPDLCQKCLQIITPEEKRFSLSRFGVQLCRPCQKTAVPK